MTVPDERAWWPNWYVTRLHAVVPEDHPFAQPMALCGAFTVHPQRMRKSGDWQEKRLAAGIPRCKHCERAEAIERARPTTSEGLKDE